MLNNKPRTNSTPALTVVYSETELLAAWKRIIKSDHSNDLPDN